jgi:hypothetical protein
MKNGTRYFNANSNAKMLLRTYQCIINYSVSLNNDKPFEHFLQDCADLEQKKETPALHSQTEPQGTGDREAI